MLATLFPQAHARYTSLPVLGGSLEGLCVWLHARGYPRDAIRRRMGAAASLARALRRRRVRSLAELTASALLSYAPPPRIFNAPPQGALVRSLTQYRAICTDILHFPARVLVIQAARGSTGERC